MTLSWMERSVEKRNDHSATAWVVAPTLTQPQDGAFDNDLNSQNKQVSRLDFQSENNARDAALTGSTRSLMSRLAGLNLMPRILPKRKMVVSTIVAIPLTDRATA